MSRFQMCDELFMMNWRGNRTHLKDAMSITRTKVLKDYGMYYVPSTRYAW